mgnify:CR=1 FL=1
MKLSQTHSVKESGFFAIHIGDVPKDGIKFLLLGGPVRSCSSDIASKVKEILQELVAPSTILLMVLLQKVFRGHVGIHPITDDDLSLFKVGDIGVLADHTGPSPGQTRPGGLPRYLAVPHRRRRCIRCGRLSFFPCRQAEVGQYRDPLFSQNLPPSRENVAV